MGFLETSVIYCDDNLERLAQFPGECVDLIYLDPPFFSNRQYEVIWGDEAEVRSFEDRWGGGIHVYVAWMRDRMMEMRRVLKRTGTVYLHCDWHASHYLKIMMDDIFGENRFRNEIIWGYKYGGRSKRDFGRKHDTILRYTVGAQWTFNRDAVTVPHEPASLEQNFRHVDDDGRRYRTGVWASGKEYRYYADEGRGRDDVWTDIGSLHQADKERFGYPTQKPEKLLEVIVEASSNKDDIVLDPFAGCGTALVAAQKLGRQWIGIDISPTAVGLMKRRMTKVGAREVKLVGMPVTEAQLRDLKPFEFQNWVIQRLNGTHSPRKSGDMGIDGFSFMTHDPIQVKQSSSVGRNVVDNFETAIERAGTTKGYVIAFSFTKNAHEEAARVRAQKGLDIELVSVADLLADKHDLVTPTGGTLLGDADAPLPAPRPADALPTAEQLVESDERSSDD